MVSQQRRSQRRNSMRGSILELFENYKNLQIQPDADDMREAIKVEIISQLYAMSVMHPRAKKSLVKPDWTLAFEVFDAVIKSQAYRKGTLDVPYINSIIDNKIVDLYRESGVHILDGGKHVGATIAAHDPNSPIFYGGGLYGGKDQARYRSSTRRSSNGANQFPSSSLIINRQELLDWFKELLEDMQEKGYLNPEQINNILWSLDLGVDSDKKYYKLSDEWFISPIETFSPLAILKIISDQIRFDDKPRALAIYLRNIILEEPKVDIANDFGLSAERVGQIINHLTGEGVGYRIKSFELDYSGYRKQFDELINLLVQDKTIDLNEASLLREMTFATIPDKEITGVLSLLDEYLEENSRSGKKFVAIFLLSRAENNRQPCYSTKGLSERFGIGEAVVEEALRSVRSFLSPPTLSRTVAMSISL